MLSSYETRLILERMEKEIRFLKALLGDTSTASEGIGTIPQETYQMQAEPVYTPERML